MAEQDLDIRLRPITVDDISVAEQDLEIRLRPITVNEVKDAIKKLMNGNAPGDDNVHAKMIKAEEREMSQLFQHILLDVWGN